MAATSAADPQRRSRRCLLPVIARRSCARTALLAGLVLLLLGLTSGDAVAQRGATLTPDRLTYIVNKDVGGDRWTITVNLATFDPVRILNLTGNVYRPGAASPSFIWCQVRPDSTGTLADPASQFRLRCSGTESCTATALGCARSAWLPIADDVVLPASFFLPAAGDRSAAQATGSEAIVAVTRASAARVDAALRGEQSVQAESGRGTTLPPDVSNFLVNKDLGADRWSISLNLIPATLLDPQSVVDEIRMSRLENRRLNITGNVFPAGGGAPLFLFCQERADSLGDLTNLQSLFRLSCLGTGPCQKTASDCAASDWQPIPGADDVRVAASFFLPAAGLPASPQSDPEIIIIGRTSDGTSIITSSAAAATVTGHDVVSGGACDVGARCTVAIGSCAAVPGRLALLPAGACACRTDSVPDECVLCGGGATGQCGGDCSYPVGSGATARGSCLPITADSSTCACAPAPFGSIVLAGQCGGALGAVCASGECCTDDPRDGCDPARGDERCAGVCVDAGGCDSATEICGSCFDQRNASGGTCLTKEVPPGGTCCDDDLCRQSGSCVCEPGTACVENVALCCPTNTPKFCPRAGDTGDSPCILAGAECCEAGRSPFCPAPLHCPASASNICIAPSDVECASGSVCGSGFGCFSGGGCLSRAWTDCGNGRACPAGTKCAAGGCVQARPDDCGNGRVCRFGDGLSCAPDGSTCVPIGGEYCGNGFACGENELCSADGKSCAPLVQCGDKFCQPGAECARDGAGCVPPGRVDCGGGASCPVGTFCGSRSSCLPDGWSDCGGGIGCPPATACDPDLLCRSVQDGTVTAARTGEAATTTSAAASPGAQLRP
jgi:hypothetical protein